LLPCRPTPSRDILTMLLPCCFVNKDLTLQVIYAPLELSACHILNIQSMGMEFLWNFPCLRFARTATLYYLCLLAQPHLF
jgi:hypothetical protein